MCERAGDHYCFVFFSSALFSFALLSAAVAYVGGVARVYYTTPHDARPFPTQRGAWSRPFSLIPSLLPPLPIFACKRSAPCCCLHAPPNLRNAPTYTTRTHPKKDDGPHARDPPSPPLSLSPAPSQPPAAKGEAGCAGSKKGEGKGGACFDDPLCTSGGLASGPAAQRPRTHTSCARAPARPAAAPLLFQSLHPPPIRPLAHKNTYFTFPAPPNLVSFSPPNRP